MDEVVEKLEVAAISRESNDEAKSNYEGLYKYWGKLGNQEDRRKQLLDIQKSNRNNKIDRFRGILELVNAVESNIFRNSKTYYRPTIYVAGFNKAPLTYSNVLMMSEWIIEKPEDFHENWYVTPCPKGVRMLVVANQGITKCYTKYGHFRFQCRTALPGGNPCDGKNRKQCCVIDCFYEKKNETMYVLDILAWNNQPMTDGETEFRHYWLKTQLDDIPELKYINKKNEMMFTLLPMTSCDPESFNRFMMTYPPFENNFPQIDGFLFYHKRAHYIAGQTPLVGWLFPYMVNEILGSEITVNEKYLEQKPADYVNQADFIEKFETKNQKKKNRSRHTSSNEMDTEPIGRNTKANVIGAGDRMDAEEVTDINNTQSANTDRVKFKSKNETDEGIKNGNMDTELITETVNENAQSDNIAKTEDSKCKPDLLNSAKDKENMDAEEIVEEKNSQTINT